MAHLRARARAQDDVYRRAYDAGVEGVDAFDLDDDDLDLRDDQVLAAYEAGRTERATRDREAAASSSSSSSTSTRPTAPASPAPAPAPRVAGAGGGRSGGGGGGGALVNDGAGFLLGLFVWALVINYLRAGPAGARAWLAAKFLNRTTETRGRGGRRLDEEEGEGVGAGTGAGGGGGGSF